MEENIMNVGYHNTRFVNDSRRKSLWRALWHLYFRHRIMDDNTVLDLGCGYGDFINSVKAKRRIALDSWPDFINHIAPDIETVVAKVTDLTEIDDCSIDFAFASNVFEHMTQPDIAIALTALRRKLTSRGQLTILQPNYRYCSSEYFDDYTHISIWSHISLTDFLTANGYEVTEVHPRFLPLTINSNFPVYQFLIALYLMSPLKPMGKQMLVCARSK
jgi:ubiquinone/menaquinone biosynthesis C-methylase UbiE